MHENKSIAEIITALDVIVQETAASQNRAGYFAALYKRMTIAVSEGIKTGAFEDGRRMEQLDIIFAQRYLTAYYNFKKGAECSSSWQCAFGGGSNNKLVVLQHLLLGINTHINLDLAIAAATVAPGEKISALQKDFNHINTLISALVDDVQHCLEQVWFPMKFLRDVVNSHGHAVLNFSISVAREASWKNALALAHLNTNTRETYINTLDKGIQQIGQRIIHPGFWPQLLLRVVRLTEYENVGRTIRLIDTTVIS